ncbi:Uncharacterised protein [Mycobacterium tuberculosis]|nr:Uncharacterised protein [Mycobacterium tuberculosis]
MADRGNLAGLGLAAVDGSAHSPGRRPAHGFHGIPEIGGARLIGDITQLPVQLATSDAEETLAGELKVVALHVDRP